MPTYNEFYERVVTTGKNYAYLKIGEGCSNRCTYCAIPYIRGAFVSRTIEDILEEAKILSKKGIKELILIAQDTTKYGLDLYGEEKLANIIYEYGEERFSRRIAKNICEYRKNKLIETTKQLVDIIEKSIPNATKKDGHPAKRTFQAIRIEVNDEIKPLYKTVKDCIQCLNPNGRLCIITFHSLEDRAVKNAYIEAKGKCTCPKDLPYCVCGAESLGEILTKKPIVATKEEILENPRSKSAKLRIFERK